MRTMLYSSLLLLALFGFLAPIPAPAATVEITWTDTNSPPANEDTYQVEWRNATASGPWNQLNTSPADSTMATHSGAPEGIQLCYRVKAQSATRATGTSTESCVNTVTFPLNAPTDVQVNQIE